MPLSSTSADITRLLAAWSEGDCEALNRLVPVLRHELHQLARRQIRAERPAHTLQPTALVHEAYLRLVDQTGLLCHNRAHFLSLCAHLMRQILIDHARKHRAVKRGCGSERLPLQEALVYAPERSAELLALDEAITRLWQTDERKGRVVELRFFGGLSNAEIGAVLAISENTVVRDWAFARAWLQHELTGGK